MEIAPIIIHDAYRNRLGLLFGLIFLIFAGSGSVKVTLPPPFLQTIGMPLRAIRYHWRRWAGGLARDACRPLSSHACHLAEQVHHRFGIGHLWHFARIDEACHFDPPRARRDAAPDQLDLVRARHQPRFVLQSVAWAYLNDFDGARHLAQVCPAIQSRTKVAASLTCAACPK